MDLPKLQGGKVWNWDGGHKDPPNRASVIVNDMKENPKLKTERNVGDKEDEYSKLIMKKNHILNK